MYQSGILHAEAESSPGMPVPVSCKWFRVRMQRRYHLEAITSNVYQLSADDIGCLIQVESTPLDEEDGEGTAYGEFGPVILDPSAR